MAHAIHHDRGRERAQGAAAAALDALRARLDGAVAALRRWRDCRRTVRELSSLSDRELADLGFSREGLQDAACRAVNAREDVRA